MVKVSDCSCECRDKGKEKMIEERALSSVNKIISTEGTPYYPDGTGAITLPVATPETVLNAEKVPGIEDEIKQMKISDAETDEAVKSLELSADNHAREIQAIKTTDQTQSNQIIALQALTDSITKSLITDVEVKTGTDAGSFIVSVIEEDGTKRSSDNFQYGRVGTFELLQGTQAGYVKGRLTLVDGSMITSNDFQILQITATDVYVTSITLTPNYQTGEISGEIGYSNGNTAQINAIKVPTAPGVTTNIEDLLTRMTAVEAKNTTQDSQIGALDQRLANIESTSGIGKFSDTSLGTILGSSAAGKVRAEADGTGSVNGWNDKADVSIVNTKANQSALDATNAEVAKKANQSDLATLQTAVQDCFNDVNYDSSTNKITFTALGGQSNTINLNGAEAWQSIATIDDIDINKLATGSQLIIPYAEYTAPSGTYKINNCVLTQTSTGGNKNYFSGSGYVYDGDKSYPITNGYITTNSTLTLSILHISTTWARSVNNFAHNYNINGFIKY